MDHIEIGKKGEDIACRYLRNNGHRVVDRNFRMKFGEIDIVSEKDRTLFFTEVKTTALKEGSLGVGHRPEENATSWKLKKLSRVVQVYLEKNYPHLERGWCFQVLAIVLELDKKTAHVKLILDVLT